MKASALFPEIVVETTQASVLIVLEARLGRRAAASCRYAVERVTKLAKLRRLLLLAVRCADIEAFQKGLQTR